MIYKQQSFIKAEFIIDPGLVRQQTNQYYLFYYDSDVDSQCDIDYDCNLLILSVLLLQKWQVLEKIKLSSQNLHYPSIGKYWNIFQRNFKTVQQHSRF